MAKVTGTPEQKEHLTKLLNHQFGKQVSEIVADWLISNGVTAPVQCFECDAEHCAYNPDGICKFALVYGREPVLHDDGCNDFCYKEG